MPNLNNIPKPSKDADQGFTLRSRACKLNPRSGFTLRSRACKLNPRSGFKLIELLIVMAIIAVLVMLFVSAYPSSGSKARDAQRKSDLKQYQTALESYSFANDGEYPHFIGSVKILQLCTSLVMSPCPDDPKVLDGKNYHYTVGAANLSYYLWAELEKEDGGFSLYQVVCSEGASGEVTTSPSGVVCPL